MGLNGIVYGVYSCLVSDLRVGLEKVWNSTYGCSIIGDKILKYIYNKDEEPIKGCFINQDITSMDYNISESIELGNSNDTINSTIYSEVFKACKNSALQIITLLHNVPGTEPIYQKYALSGEFVGVNKDKGFATILDQTYSLYNDIFSFNKKDVFLGIVNEAECSIKYLHEHIFPYSIDQLSSTYDPYSQLSEYYYRMKAASYTIPDYHIPPPYHAEGTIIPTTLVTLGLAAVGVVLSTVGAMYLAYKKFTSNAVNHEDYQPASTNHEAIEMIGDENYNLEDVSS